MYVRYYGLGNKGAGPMLMSLSDRDIPEVIDTCVQYTSVEVPPAQGMLGDSSMAPSCRHQSVTTTQVDV